MDRSAARRKRLHMLKVLIVDDELPIADMVEETLVNNGYEVCSIARDVDEAVALARSHKPDLAVIDLRLTDGGFGTQIAAQLGGPDRLGILYASANISRVTLSAADGEACLIKPYGAPALLRGLEIVAEILVTGRASPPFPPGFQLLSPPGFASLGLAS
jgi:DNA-binding response OmpR family regulator